MKNADIIKDMSDEELQELFGYCENRQCEQCPASRCCKQGPDADCREAFQKWLEQDIEED